MIKIKLYIIVIFTFFYCVIGYCFEWEELEKVEKNSKIQREIIGYMRTFYIDETKYQEIKNQADNFKDTNYMVYENFAYEDNNKLTACNLINFNQNYITGIYLKRMPKNKDINLYDNLSYEESYITYKDGQKINIRDAEFFKCGDLDIKDCNKTGNDGIECLKLLPNECEFVISSKNGSFCIDLKNDKTALIEFGCDSNGCTELNNFVEYIYD